MAHLGTRFLSVIILILILGFAASIITGQILAGNITTATKIKECKANGFHSCEESMPHVYGIKEA